MIELLSVLLSLLPFYLLGSLPTGKILAKVRGINLEDTGSGNIGATNVTRLLGRRAGAITLVIDSTKGALAVILAMLIVDAGWYHGLVAFTVVTGHCFSLPRISKGGKGVATTLGACLVLSPICTLIAVAIFGLTFWWWRIVSLASIVAVSIAPVLSLILGRHSSEQYALIAIALIVIYRHRQNLVRISEGREPKFKVSQ